MLLVELELGDAALMSAAPRPELAAVCTTSPPIAAAVVLAGVLLVELELGDRRADVGRAEPASGPRQQTSTAQPPQQPSSPTSTADQHRAIASPR